MYHFLTILIDGIYSRLLAADKRFLIEKGLLATPTVELVKMIITAKKAPVCRKYSECISSFA